MPHESEDFTAEIKMLEEQIARDEAELDANPLILAADAPEPTRDSAFFRRACDNLCDTLDALLDKAYAENNDETPLTKEEFAEYEHEFKQLKCLLAEYEIAMNVSKEFEAIESANDLPRN